MNCQKHGDIWLIVQWQHFDDGSEEAINLTYAAEATEEEVLQAFDSNVRFLNMTKEELLEVDKCFEVPEDDRDYIADRFPVMPPPRSDGRERFIRGALKSPRGHATENGGSLGRGYATDDPGQRANSEFEAVSAYYAETAGYWKSDVFKDWQRNNPIAAEWMNEFSRVFHKPRKELDPVDHEIVFNWLRRGYNFLTAEELSDAVLKETGKQISPEAIKKRGNVSAS